MSNNREILKDVLRQSLNLAFAFAQFVIPCLPGLGIGRFIGVQTEVPNFRSPENPADFAFSIWFVIFVLSVVYAAVQTFSRKRDDPLLRDIGFQTAILFFLSSLWMLIVQMSGDGWLPLLIIIYMLICSLTAFFRFLKSGREGVFESRILSPLLGFYSGWLSIAVWLNFSSVLKRYEFIPVDLPEELFAVLILCPAMFLSLKVIFKSGGNVYYAAAVVWALIGIVAANILEKGNIFMAAMAAVLAVLILAAVWAAYRLNPHPDGLKKIIDK